MTVPDDDSGGKAKDEAGQSPSEGGHEAPPIEQSQGQPSYDTPPSPTSPPTYQAPGYEEPRSYPSAFNYPPPNYPPQGYAPPPPGYQDPSGYQNPPTYGSAYPPPPPPPQSREPYGSYPGAYRQAPQARTNTLAIASLVASVIGLVPFCGSLLSIVGIVLGAVALNQIKQTHQEGYGLALAGIVVGVATLLISLIWTIYAWR